MASWQPGNVVGSRNPPSLDVENVVARAQVWAEHCEEQCCVAGDFAIACVVAATKVPPDTLPEGTQAIMGASGAPATPVAGARKPVAEAATTEAATPDAATPDAARPEPVQEEATPETATPGVAGGGGAGDGGALGEASTGVNSCAFCAAC